MVKGSGEPIFVDPSGGRGRKLRRLALLVVAPLSGYLLMLGNSLLGPQGVDAPSVPPAEAERGQTITLRSIPAPGAERSDPTNPRQSLPSAAPTTIPTSGSTTVPQWTPSAVPTTTRSAPPSTAPGGGDGSEQPGSTGQTSSTSKPTSSRPPSTSPRSTETSSPTTAPPTTESSTTAPSGTSAPEGDSSSPGLLRRVVTGLVGEGG